MNGEMANSLRQWSMFTFRLGKMVSEEMAKKANEEDRT
jgi:hypothetical protein